MKNVFALTFVSLLFSVALNAAEQPTAKTRPFSGTIKTINKAAQTVVLKGKKAQTFKILAETKIQREGKPVRFDDIAVGDNLGGYARQALDGHWDALTLNLKSKMPEAAGSPSPAPEASPAAGPKKPKVK